MVKNIPNRICPKCGSTQWVMSTRVLSTGEIRDYPSNCVGCMNIKSQIDRNNISDRYVKTVAANYYHKPYHEITAEEFENQKNRIIAHRLAKAERNKLVTSNNTLADYYDKNKEEILSAMSTPKTSVEQYEALAAIDEAKVEISPTSEIGMMIQKLMKMEKRREEVYSHLKAINELLI